MADPARRIISTSYEDRDDRRDPDVSESYDERRHGAREHFYAHAASGRYWQRRRPMFSDEQLHRLYERGRELLLQAMRERPLTTIGGGFVLGYLLAYGLPPAIARSFAGLGLRVLLQELGGVESQQPT
ncbi:MAG: hypothetical protein HC927_13650 [Deltaproteobacteria bacterium]|nr:hypothetical protein [Deltaproteobacteria bacterium]